MGLSKVGLFKVSKAFESKQDLSIYTFKTSLYSTSLNDLASCHKGLKFKQLGGKK